MSVINIKFCLIILKLCTLYTYIPIRTSGDQNIYFNLQFLKCMPAMTIIVWIERKLYIVSRKCQDK